jgi:hypothetical protein
MFSDHDKGKARDSVQDAGNMFIREMLKDLANDANVPGRL